MIQALEASSRRLSVKKSHGRVANAIAAMLRQQLSIPQVFLKPRLPGYSGIDVMAVDRGGSGDVHGVEIKVSAVLPTRSGLRTMLKTLNSLPVHFRYLAFNSPGLNLDVLSKLADYDELFDSAGIGRVGVMAFDDKLLDRDNVLDPKSVVIVVRPERFLVRGEKLMALERYLRHAKPDIDVRI